MKKIIAAFSLTAMLGLSFYGFSHTDIDGSLPSTDTGEKTYIVSVAGNVTGSDEEKEVAAKNRAEVLSKLALKLDEDSYEVTYIYDTVFNGFAIKTTPDNAEILKDTLSVKDVQVEHTYAVPDDDTNTTVTTYNTDGTTTIKEQKLANYSAETMDARDTDIANIVNSTSKQGEGVTVGILDTGLFLNQVEGTSARTTAETNYGSLLNAAAFKPLASGVTQTFTEDNLKTKTSTNFSYINSKIPFAYDYAGNDNDVDPTTAGNEHGTHVASLAGANGDDFTGIAPKSQIAVMKVFGDNSSGASTSAIIAAINDSAKLGLDIINLSLGTDLVDVGESEDSVDNATYKAVKAASDAGVIVNFSAGNAGKSSFSSGDYADYTTDTVESGILGSDANFDEAANIVASSTPDKAFYTSIMNVTSENATASSAVSYSDQVVSSSTQTFTEDRELTDLLGYTEAGSITGFDADTTYYTYDAEQNTYTEVDADDTFDSTVTYYVQNTSVTKEYYVVPGYGTASDYQKEDTTHGGTVASNVSGKIAVIHRGNTTFVDKVTQAQNNGAIAAVVINNDPSTTFNFSMAFNDMSPDIPVVFVFQNSTSAWGDAYTKGSVSLMVNTVADAADGNTVSSFSSDGPSSNLDIGPTISAPGTLIMGAVNATSANDTDTSNSYLYGYENMSGTSMAAPNLSGALALALGEKKANMTDTEFAAEKKVISQKAMATADQLIDGAKTSENSPRLQGAGRINVASLLTADSYIEVANTDDDDFGNTLQSKAELKNSGDLYVKDGDFANATGEDYIEFNYTVHNDSDKAKTYTASISVMIPELEIQLTHDSYAAEEDTSKMEELGYDSSVTFDEDDASTYPTFVGTPTVSVRDDTLTGSSDEYYTTSHSGTTTLTVPANGSATGTAKIRIDNLTVNKEWGDTMVDDFSGTLREYLAEYFTSSGGTYVEGYLKLEETSDQTDLETLTLPYMGFYGDYSVAEAVEPFDFEKEEQVVDGKYNSNYHIYNSDLTDHYLKGLNATYAKPNAYSGSAMMATGSTLTSTQLNSIGNFETSPVANGSTFLSVVGDDDNHIYAGATGISDHLNAFFFVNRSISEATYAIKDSSGNTVNNGSGSIMDLMPYNGSYMTTTSYGLVKSWLTTDDSGYVMNRGYASIDLSKVAEGEYTLEFSFTLKGAKDTNGNQVVQTKSYPLTVDKTAPELVSASLETSDSGTTYLNVQAKGANNTFSIGALSSVGTLVDGTTDTYSARIRISSSLINADKATLTVTDYAHNELVVIIHPSNINFSVGSTFFTDRNDFFISEVNSDTHLYNIEILDRNGDAIDPNDIEDDYYIYIQLATGLTDLEVYVDSIETDDYTYDSSTGMLIIHMPSDASSFQINHIPGESTDSDGTSSSTTDGGTSSDSESGGCFGSIITTTSVVGALALLGAGLVFKKKKEDK